MIEFVDLKDGKIFNGESPYVFWFDGGQSVNLNYIRKVCVISTYPFIRVGVQSDVFSLLRMDQNTPQLYDPEKLGGRGEYINEKLYLDIEYLKTDSIVSEGSPYNDFYIHLIYFLGQSTEAGEIHDNFYITDKDGTFEFEVAADFYMDNELLKTNLNNFDVSIPESIQKAIFDVNVHEESNDNITLNRKYKELLMNYWNIIANKGSYNSLQNSLAWFEWGDLTRIEEVWKRHHEGMVEYFETELNRELDYEFIKEFLNNSKTTYIGLYTALEHIVVENGMLRYQGFKGVPEHPMTPAYDSQGNLLDDTNYIYEESNPWLKPILTKWEMIDLCLKMTLLGNFYSTYFTPIHMETIHSTLEHWVFAYTTKVLHTTGTDPEVVLNNIRQFDMVWDKRVKMREYVCRNYSDTLFLSNGVVFGYEEDLREEPFEAFRTTGQVLSYHMGGTYGVARFKVMPDNPILAGDENDKIIRQVLHWLDDSGNCGDVVSYVPMDAEYLEREGFRKTQWVFLPEFKLGFMNPGHYTIGFEFDTLYGNVWTRQIELDIEDDTRNHIDLYKVVKRDDIDELEFDKNIKVWLKSFQVGTGVNQEASTDTVTNPEDGKEVLVYTPYMEHSLFFQQFVGAGIDINHTVIFDIPDSTRLLMINDGILIDTSNPDIIYDNLKGNIPKYIWIVNRPYERDGVYQTRVIGISRESGEDLDFMVKSIQDADAHKELDKVMSFRFHPFMHRLIPLYKDDKIDSETGKIESTDLIYAVPQLGHSRDIEVRNWVFENATTQEVFESYLTSKRYYPDGKYHGDTGTKEKFGGMQGWFIAPQDTIKLKPGYYNIKLQYLKGNDIQEYQVKSAFLMEK